MTFLISKLVGGLLAPGTLLMLALAAAFILHRRRPRTSRALLAGALLFVSALSLMPLGHWLVSPLETRFPVPEPQALTHVDGIIVLGGSIYADEASISHQSALNDAGDRMTTFVALSRRYPDARLVWSGGSANIRGQPERFSEAVSAEQLLNALGVPSERMTYERVSRNTWENALFSKRLVDPKPGETWLLVTSSWHMPRSVGIFRKVGWTVVPYPVDFPGNDPDAWGRFEANRELYTVSLAVREWIGLVSYHLLGRTTALFPAPEPEPTPTPGNPT